MVKATLLNEEVHEFLVEYKEEKVAPHLWQYVLLSMKERFFFFDRFALEKFFADSCARVRTFQSFKWK